MERLFDQMRRSMWAPYGETGYGRQLRDQGEALGPLRQRTRRPLRGRLTTEATHEYGDEHSSRSRPVFERVRVSGEVRDDEITASWHDGVLEVHLPTPDPVEEDHPTRIDVEDTGSRGVSSFPTRGCDDLSLFVRRIPTPDMSDVPDRVEEFLTSEPLTAHLATSNDDRPHVAPVWFHYEDGVVEVVTAGRKLRDIRENPYVSLSIERSTAGDPEWTTTLHGTAAVVEDDEVYREANRRINRRYGAPEDAWIGENTLVRVDIGSASYREY
jgi:nitroimidazol reductase NimA-like FMN-containing flavoprotein (pyridoxamine 5'-phosphate oxidase superfamily)